MLKKTLVPAVAVALALGLLLAAPGCGGNEEKPSKGASVPEQGRQAVQSGAQNPGGRNASLTVTMNGRSVMEGWMKHWGYAWEGPVEKNGYALDYKELDASTIQNMAPSFKKNVEGLPPGSVVFFKFCFADFGGNSVKTLEGIVDEVVATAREKGLRLIIGNALPVRKQDGNPQMVADYGKYNALLDETARRNQGVWVYDFYGILAGPDGFLKPEYQTGDSHPNDAAYSALDGTFFPLLDGIFGR